MIKYCLEHWRDLRTCPGEHYLPVGHRWRRYRGLLEELLVDDDDDKQLGDGSCRKTGDSSFTRPDVSPA